MITSAFLFSSLPTESSCRAVNELNNVSRATATRDLSELVEKYEIFKEKVPLVLE